MHTIFFFLIVMLKTIKELILLGNINCDVAKSPPEAHTIRFQSINTLYNLAQLIEESTRVARTSATIIDLILTNVPEKISHAGVIHVSISDRSLIYVVHKFKPFKRRSTIKKFVILNTFLKNNLYPT
jgi:hypothetical protein